MNEFLKICLNKIQVKELFKVFDKLEINLTMRSFTVLRKKIDEWKRRKECCVLMIQFSKKYHLTIMNV